MYSTKNKFKGFATSFALCGAIAAVILLFQTIMGDGIMLYAGDFNAQQIPFNYYVSSFLQNGGGTFSWQTDLGSSFINSYSFYVLGSPFYWLVSWLPASFMPYMMYPLLILKFAVMGGGVYLWSERHVEDDKWAIAAAMLFAFSGYSLVNIFFNHFIDVIALFPYLLWSLDEAVIKNKKAIFAIFVALNFLVNYFFFFGEVVFLVMYFLINWTSGDYEITIKKFIQLAIETIIGCMIACVLAIPAFFALIETERASSTIAGGVGALVYTYGEHYLALIMSLFMSPDRCFAGSIFKNTTVNWTSMSMYIPALSFSGVLVYFSQNKGMKDKWKRMFSLCLVFMFVPVLNASFTFLNSSYYARWFYMPLLIGVLMTVLALEKNSKDVLKTLAWILVAVVTYGALLFILGAEIQPTTFGALFFPTIFCGVKMLSTLYFYAETQNLSSKIITSLLFCCILFGGMHTYLTGQYAANGIHLSNIKDSQTLEPFMPESEVDYRTDSYSTVLNNGNLYSNLQTVKTFNSTVESSIANFYTSLGHERKTRFEETIKHPALYAFLNVKYTIINSTEAESHESSRESIVEKRDEYEKEKDWTAEKAALQIFDISNNPDYKLIGTESGYLIYENLNYVGQGFVFDTYITEGEFATLSQQQKEYALLKTAVLSAEDAEKYRDLFVSIFDKESSEYTKAAMLEDMEKLSDKTFTIFSTDNYGFSATQKLDKESLVVLSVPYSENWTITANGKPVDFIRVDNGMLGLILPKGELIIRADYIAKGEKEGRLIAILGIFALIGYIGYAIIDRKRNPETPEIYNELDLAIAEFESYEDIGLDDEVDVDYMDLDSDEEILLTEGDINEYKEQ